MNMRRLCGLLALLLPAGAAQGQADRPETPRHADPVVQAVQNHINRLCDAHDARLAKIDSAEALEKETTAARRAFLKLLDLDLDAPRTPPKATTTGTIDAGDYTIEKVIVESAPGVPVTCNVYVPKGGPAKKPALISPHGHSGRDRPVYQNALQRLAKAGFVVLAKDGWGKQERRGTGHGEAGGSLALTGTELMSLELFDNVRTLDYIVTRAYVDPERLGMAGLSGGGSQTLYTAAIEPRLKAASPTCAVTTFRSDLADTTMCVCELAHDVLTVGDHGLFLAMAYPRPLLVVNGIKDGIFPIAGARAAAAQAKKLYAAAGKPDGVEFADYDVGHDWSDPMIDRQIAFFRRAFGMEEIATPAKGDGPRDEDTLNCYPDRDLPGGSLRIADVNRSRMGSKTGASIDDDRAALVRRISERWSGEPSAPSRVDRRTMEDDPRHGAKRERLSWPSGLGGTVSLTLTRPPAEKAAGRVVIHMDDRDHPEPYLERLYRDDKLKGSAVIADLAYTGVGLDGAREAQVSSALVSSGRSLLAERVRDLLVALRVLRDAGVIDDERKVRVVGHGFDGVLVLVAAAFAPFEPFVDRTPISYRVGPDVDFHTTRSAAPPYHWTILPGFAKDHDVVNLIELAQGRRVVVTHPLDAAQQPMSRAEFDGLLTRIDRGRVEALTREEPRAEALRRMAGW